MSRALAAAGFVVLVACTSSSKPSSAPPGSSSSSSASSSVKAVSSTSVPSTTPTTRVTTTPAPPLTQAQASALVAGMTGPFGHWVPDASLYDPATDLTVIIGNTPSGTGSSPEQAFLFHRGVYLGTGTSDPRSAFEVSAHTNDTVTISYAHYAPNDPTCCPSQPPFVVRYHWDGTHVVPLDPIPPADQGETN